MLDAGNGTPAPLCASDRLAQSAAALQRLFTQGARGVQAILPHVDAHRPVHNLDSLAAFGRDLAQLTRAHASTRQPQYPEEQRHGTD